MNILLSILFSVMLLPLTQPTITCDTLLTPDDSAVDYLRRAEACLEQAPRIRLDQIERNIAQAFEDSTYALELDPTLSEAFSTRSQARFWLGQYGQAIVDTTHALQLAPNHAELYSRRAFLMWQVDDLAGAVEDLNYAITLQPDEVNFYVQRADYHLRLDQVENALADLNYAAELAPQRADLYQRTGDIYYEQEQYQLALENYEQYLSYTSAPSPLVRARLMIINRNLEN